MEVAEPKGEPRALICHKCLWETDEIDGSNRYVYRAQMAPLLSHIRRIHFGYQPYVCSHCLAVFPTVADVDHHTDICHGGDLKIVSRRDKAIERRADEDLRRILVGNSTVDGQNDEDQNAVTGTRKDPLFCSECNYRLEHSNLENERVALLNMDPLACHLRRIHFGYQPYKCEHCQGMFPTLSDIERHIEKAHHGEWQVSIERNDDIEAEVKQTIAEHGQAASSTVVVNNGEVDAPAASVPTSHNTRYAARHSATAAIPELLLEPIIRIERCASAPPIADGLAASDQGSQDTDQSSQPTTSGRQRASRPTRKYQEFVRALSSPKKRGRPRKLEFAQALSKPKKRGRPKKSGEGSTNHFTPAALKACFGDDYRNFQMRHNLRTARCPICNKFCKTCGIVAHIRASHKLDSAESRQLFTKCKLCESMVYQELAHVHATVCFKARGQSSEQSMTPANPQPKEHTAKKRRQRTGSDVYVIKAARMENGDLHASGRGLRSESRNISTSTHAADASSSGVGANGTQPVTRQIKRELNMGYGDGEENGNDTSYWDFDTQE